MRFFSRLSAYFDRDYDLEAENQRGNDVSCCGAIFAVIIVIVLLGAVVPKFCGDSWRTQVFPLPGLTKALIFVGRFIGARWYMVIAVFALIVLGIQTLCSD